MYVVLLAQNPKGFDTNYRQWDIGLELCYKNLLSVKRIKSACVVSYFLMQNKQGCPISFAPKTFKIFQMGNFGYETDIISSTILKIPEL